MGGGARLEKLQHEGKLDAFLAEHNYKGKPLADLLGGLMKKARPLKGAKLLAFHESWVYFEETYGCKFVETLEPKPGSLRRRATSRRSRPRRSAPVPGPRHRVLRAEGIADDFASRIGAKTASCRRMSERRTRRTGSISRRSS